MFSFHGVVCAETPLVGWKFLYMFCCKFLPLSNSERIMSGNVWSMPERFNVVCIPCKALYKCCAFCFIPHPWSSWNWRADKAESLQRPCSSCQQHLIVPRTRMRLCTISDQSFHVTAAQAWNSLPISVTTATFLASFKRQLKTFLFTKLFAKLKFNCVPCLRSTFAYVRF